MAGPGREVKCCWALICGVVLLFVSGILLYMAFRTYTPSCSITDLYIPALDTSSPIFNSSAAPAATFIFFDLQLDNREEHDNHRYEFINITLAFYTNVTAGFPIANYTVPKFSQGDEETAHLRDLVETLPIMPWSDALAAVSGGSTVAFTVEFAATVKVKRSLGHTGDKELWWRGYVEVNDSGEIVQKKDIKLVPFAKSISKSDDDALINVYSAYI